MTFKRKEDMKQGDHFLFIESLGLIYLKNEINKDNQYYGVKVKNLSQGFIHFGLCTLRPSKDRSNNCVEIQYDDFYEFHGINISYFAPNCFHFDQYVRGNYEITSNNCLSEYEILEMEFSLKITFDPQKKMVFLQIHYNGYEYYNFNLRTLANHLYDMAVPCLALGTKNSEIQIINKDTYP
jgi:hypothetical protein